MTEFEKSIYGSHTIESSQVLTEKETGRVVAVFYNDYDMNAVLKMQDQITELEAKLKETESKLKKVEADYSWAVVPEGARY